ncbi:MAG TPA: ATP-binding cassette domain-containing protein, partial [Thermomicrobiales bacterium]|nr:ATP-binding cassette domain-containing protein [Thermomicrobiales bacterium]
RGLWGYAAPMTTATDETAKPMIQARNLTKHFRRPRKQPGLKGALRHLVRPEYADFTAVDGVDLTIYPGESVAYVGPNGAGKSTTVKLLTGILVPTAGDISVCGLRPFEHRMTNARNIGVVFGQRTQLWWDIPVRESFRLLGDIYEVPPATYAATFAELVDVLDLQPLLPVPARQLSLGQRMRCDLAASLIHSPPVLYLDEPTIVLDVEVKALFRVFIRYMHDPRGLTVVLTSHDLGDIEELCERMIMIDKGTIVYDGALAEVTRRFGWEQSLHLTLSEPAPDAAATSDGALARRSGTTVTQPDDIHLTVTFDSREATSGELIRDLATAVPITDIRIEEPSAESIIRKLYEGSLQFESAVEW